MQAYRKLNNPTPARITNVHFDMEYLRQEVQMLNDKWVNVYQANRGLHTTHEDLAAANYHHFDQINLAYLEPSLNDFLDISDRRSECKAISQSDVLGDSQVMLYRTKINRLEHLPPAMNEHNWYHAWPIYQDSWIRSEIEKQFKAKTIIVRLTRLRASKHLTPHIYYDTTYAVRMVVLICGTEGVKNVFWPRNQREEYNMPADGSAYFLTVGYKYSVKHNVPDDRLALMSSLATQEDVLPWLLS